QLPVRHGEEAERSDPRRRPAAGRVSGIGHGVSARVGRRPDVIASPRTWADLPANFRGDGACQIADTAAARKIEGLAPAPGAGLSVDQLDLDAALSVFLDELAGEDGGGMQAAAGGLGAAQVGPVRLDLVL